jgi:hypothetical protein
MGSFTISPPSHTSGFNKEEHVSHLCLFIEPKGEETPGFSGDGTQLAARCHYIVCVTCDLVLSDFAFFGNAIVPKIITAGEIVAGRLALGTARGDRNAPYLLTDPTNDDLRIVEAFLDERATRMPSGKIIIEPKPADDDDTEEAM